MLPACLTFCSLSSTGLGVISIGTSKLLLTYHGDAVPPLTLTLQQLLIGSTLLRFLLEVRFLSSPGVLPWPLAASPATTQRRWSYVSPPPSKQQSGVIKMLQTVTGGKLVDTRLLLAGIFFSTGFLATNYGFSGAAASFVETIKAAEPITSASVAVLGGIEVLGSNEVFSLITIVAGVLLSTLGNGAGSHSNDNAVATSVQQSLKTCAIVLLANICFSYRGLYQKLFRNDPTAGALDDVNLQYRMQQIGVTMLLVPALLLEGPSIMSYWWSHGTYQAFSRFFLLSLLNGFAFTSYNLASTFILTRISVVHHAALNCLRRVFAILITSFYFVVPITFLGGVGIVLSTAGFLSFTHFKAQRQRQPKPVSSLLPISRNGSGAIPEVSLP
jgi:drug/metabolite transporter (DMT)-like permease